MAPLQKIVRVETMAGTPVQVGDWTITPQARALSIRLPFGGLVWNRPAAVLVERAGQVERIPIPDVTRQVQLVLTACIILLMLVLRMQASRRKEVQDDGERG